MENSKNNSLLVGITFILLGILGLLDLWYISGTINYFLSFAFGMFFPLVYAYLIYIGIYQIKNRKYYTFKFSFVKLGIILIWLSLALFTSYHENMEFSNSASTYLNYFNEIVAPFQFAYSTSLVNLGGGIIGFFITSLFTTFGLSKMIIEIIALVIALGGVFCVLKKLITRLIFKVSLGRKNKEDKEAEKAVNEFVSEEDKVNTSYSARYTHRGVDEEIISSNRHATAENKYNDNLFNEFSKTKTVNVTSRSDIKEIINPDIAKTKEFEVFEGDEYSSLNSKDDKIKESKTNKDDKTVETFLNNGEGSSDYSQFNKTIKETKVLTDPYQVYSDKEKKKQTDEFFFDLIGKEKPASDNEEKTKENNDNLITKENNSFSTTEFSVNNQEGNFDEQILKQNQDLFDNGKITQTNLNVTDTVSVKPVQKSIFDKDPSENENKAESKPEEIVEEKITEASEKIEKKDDFLLFQTSDIPFDINENLEVNKKPQSSFNNPDTSKTNNASAFKLPSIDLLNPSQNKNTSSEKINDAENKKQIINECLEDLGIGAQVVSYQIGPSVTRFDVKLNPHVKTSSLNPIEEDLALWLGGNKTVRIVNIVEGRNTSGIEVGNQIAEPVSFRECIASIPLSKENRLSFPVGKDISGNVIKGTLNEMPHLLVCGTTGSGKSVFIHNIIMSLIMRNNPDDVRLMLVDPKKIEFTRYRDLPNLLCPVITTVESGKAALMRLVEEMERRYDLFALQGRGASSYEEYERVCAKYGYDHLPYIVVIIDEFADFMSDGDKELNRTIQRIVQKARACGIHLVVATQRPSTKVITGDIKANIPSRIALSVSSSVDSRVIIDENGAENLLGKGDLLARLPDHKSLLRLQSAYVSGEEIYEVCEYIKKQREFVCDPNFTNLEFNEDNLYSSSPMKDYHYDEKYEDIKEYILKTKRCVPYQLTNLFGMGASRVEGILSALEEDGVLVRVGKSRVLNEQYYDEGNE